MNLPPAGQSFVGVTIDKALFKASVQRHLASWPTKQDARDAILAHVRAVAAENKAAIGTGVGGAGNKLRALKPGTIRRKGHGQQVFWTGTMKRAIDSRQTRDGGELIIRAWPNKRTKIGSQILAPLLIGGMNLPFLGVRKKLIRDMYKALVQMTAARMGAKPRLREAYTQLANIPSRVILGTESRRY